MQRFLQGQESTPPPRSRPEKRDYCRAVTRFFSNFASFKNGQFFPTPSMLSRTIPENAAVSYGGLGGGG